MENTCQPGALWKMFPQLRFPKETFAEGNDIHVIKHKVKFGFREFCPSSRIWKISVFLDFQQVPFFKYLFCKRKKEHVTFLIPPRTTANCRPQHVNKYPMDSYSPLLSGVSLNWLRSSICVRAHVCVCFLCLFSLQFGFLFVHFL